METLHASRTLILSSSIPDIASATDIATTAVPTSCTVLPQLPQLPLHYSTVFGKGVS